MPRVPTSGLFCTPGFETSWISTLRTSTASSGSNTRGFQQTNWEWLWAAVLVPMVGWLWTRWKNSRATEGTGTKIEGELRVASAGWSPTWKETAHLLLRNVHVDAVRDTPQQKDWPKKIELDGFTYRRYGGLGTFDEEPVRKRRSKWFEKWLERDQPYTAQPYHQCANVLREMGQPGMANDVLYAGRERARKESRGGRRLGLELLKWTIGYGYGHRYFWSLYWVAGFVLLGSLVLVFVGGADKIIGAASLLNESLYQYAFALAAYSLDMLLPIVKLHEPHYDVVLDGLARYYFFFHKTMGYVLGSFLVAGLSGLTK